MLFRFSVVGVFTFACLAASIQPAAAAVSTTGTVTFGEPNGGDSFGIVTVGPQRFTQPTGDPRGAITIDGGTQFQAERLSIGERPDALARATVTGRETKVSLSDDQETLTVGLDGSGYLRIEEGAWVDVGSVDQQFGELLIGPTEESPFSGPAHVEVAGAGSLLTVGGHLSVSDGIDSRLSISDGAVVRVGSGGQESVHVGGLVEVQGARSELQAASISVGSDGRNRPFSVGRLHIGDGAAVRPYREGNQFLQLGNHSEVVLSGGSLGLGIQNMSGTLRGSGTVTGDITSWETGKISVGAGEELNLQGNVSTHGSIEAIDGALTAEGRVILEDVSEFVGNAEITRSEVNFLGGVTNRGDVQVRDSTVRFSGDFFGNPPSLLQQHQMTASNSRIEIRGTAVNSGLIELADSTLEIEALSGLTNNGGGVSPNSARLVLEGSRIEGGNSSCCEGGISNQGILEIRSDANAIEAAVSGGGALIIREDASVDFTQAEFFGGIAVAAGGTATFSGSSQVDQLLDITLADANQSTATLSAVGEFPLSGPIDFTLNGRLVVDADELTNVEVDDEFLLVEADQLFGDFSEYELPELPGTLEFLPQLTDTTLSLLVVDTTETLPGDFNSDGAVNAADYTLWRDGELPGGSRWLDHALWQSNYGRTLALPATNAVPEPLSAVVALVGVLAGLGFRRLA